jgi:hypothetical protein
MQCSHDNFRSDPEEFEGYSFEHLDLFYEEDFQLLLCSDFDKGKDMVFLNKDTCDNVFHLPSFPLSRNVTKDASRGCASCLNFSLGQGLFLEFKGRLNALRSLVSQSFNFPIKGCQSSSRFLLVPSQTLGSDEVQFSQLSDSFSQPLEFFTFHDPF